MKSSAAILTLVLSLWCGSAFGSESSAYCASSKDLSNFKAQAYLSENRLAVQNHGGLLNGGVCWWHSLFQRASLYLTVFEPQLPKPSQETVEKLVHAIASGRQVVVIPGYKNMNDFSRDHWPAIQAKLEEWQLVDGFLKQAWIKSITSTYKVDPAKLSHTMDLIYNDVEKKKQIDWVMLKVKGIGAHAWLVADIVATSKGYELAVIDSNRPEEMLNVLYERGMDSLQATVGRVAPYRGRQSFFAHFKSARKQFCRGQRFKLYEGPLYNGIY